MINKLQALRETRNEDGFTLIELMIVVVIIGILAAIAIPIFTNQQKGAINSGVKSDVKNTNTVLATELAKDPTAPNVSSLVSGSDVVASDDNTVVVVSGSWDNYTVRGVNNSTEFCWEFSSATGKTDECVFVPGEVQTPGEDDGNNGELQLVQDVYGDYQYMKYVLDGYMPDSPYSAENPRITAPGTVANIVVTADGYTMEYTHPDLTGRLYTAVSNDAVTASEATGDFEQDFTSGGGGMG